MVEIFREVRRVLRSDGVLFCNLGDSYARNGGTPGGGNRESLHMEGKQHRMTSIPENTWALKEKDLCGIPWRVAFALQADGWWLRQDIIWHKPNHLPESVTDRCTKAHEYIFLLTKSAKYFYDAEAVKEPSSGGESAGNGKRLAEQAIARTGGIISGGVEKSTLGTSADSTRNKRSVWTVPSAPYSEAHFATFPPNLIKPCILAGTSAKGACPKCGAPWKRVVENGEPDMKHRAACGADASGGYNGKATKDYASAKCQDPSAVKARILAGMVEKKTTGWQPTCECKRYDAGAAAQVCAPTYVPLNPIPCTVLDPFGGSGTTGMVSIELGRKATLIELNPDYANLIRQRCHVTPGLPLS